MDKFPRERVQKGAMSMSSSYSIGQMNQLSDALDAAGFSPDDVTKLRQSDLGGFLNIIRSSVKDASRVITINKTTIVVNLGATPKLPFDEAEVAQHLGTGWVIVEKRVDGLYVNDDKVILHLSKRQQNGEYIRGYELCEELAGKPVLNANVLDALYEHPSLIPEDWKKDGQGNIRYIFFWASTYRDAGGRLCVRDLYFGDRAWSWGCNWLGHVWHGSYSAALLAN